MGDLISHFDETGIPAMVDVGQKKSTCRTAIAKGEVRMTASTVERVSTHSIKKGDVFVVAQLAGIMAAKRTAELIPLCHPLQPTFINVCLSIDKSIPGIKITSEVKCMGRTGVEMEALTAVSVAALTVYDMLKSIDKTMQITNVRLIEKHGGSSGDLYYE